MKVITELKDVISLEFYSDCVLLGYRNDGLCTLIRKYNFSFIYPGKWFKSWKKFYSKYFLVELEDGYKTLIYKSDGSFVNEDLKFKNWETFPWTYWLKHDQNYISVERDDGLKTLLRLDDLSFLCKDKWAKEWESLDKDHITMILEDRKSTLIDPVTGDYIYDNVWFYNFWKDFNKDYYLVSVDDNYTLTLISKKDGSLVNKDFLVHYLYDFGDRYLAFKNINYGVFVSKDNFSIIDENIKISKVDVSRLDENCFKLYIYDSDNYMIAKYNDNENVYSLINNDIYCYCMGYNDTLLFRKSENNLSTLISNDGDVILDNFSAIEHFFGTLYLITMPNGLSSPFDIKAKKYIYENVWFKKWEAHLGDKLYVVEREDGLQTIINRKDASFVYDNLWFDWWHTTKFGYYEVSLNKKINYVKKDDGTFLLSEFIPQDRIIESDNYDNKIYVLENEKIYMYEL